MEPTPQNFPLDPHPKSSQSNTFDQYPATDQPRVRSKSDTSSRPPTWGLTPLNPLSSIGRTSNNHSDNRRHSKSKGEFVHPPDPRTDSTNGPNARGDQGVLHPTQPFLRVNPSSNRGLGDRGIGALPDVPYPSPDGSPSLRSQPLPFIPSLHDFSVSSATGRGRPTSMSIGRPDTTGNSSERRRRSLKSFTCPSPGCGKTFDRDATLRGTSPSPIREE